MVTVYQGPQLITLRGMYFMCFCSIQLIHEGYYREISSQHIIFGLVSVDFNTQKSVYVFLPI